MATDSDYLQYFLNTRSCVASIDCLQISHPAFSQTYYIVRNLVEGIQVTHEDGSLVTYTYYPVQITKAKQSDDLDSSLKVSFGDINAVLYRELSNILGIVENELIKPELIYRTYRSDNLTKLLSGPWRYEMSKISFNEEGCTFSATAATLNATRTGRIYALDKYPSLRGFV